MEQGGQRGGRGGRLSKVWVRAPPGSIWESSLAWKHESGISGLTNRRSRHESFASPAQLHRRAGCGPDESPAQPQALPGPLYVIRGHERRPRATPAAAGNGRLQPCPPCRGAGPAVSCPFAPSPAGLLRTSYTSSQAALRGGSTEKHPLTAQKAVPYRLTHAGAEAARWSPNDGISPRSGLPLPEGITLPTMKVCFPEPPDLQHWGTCAAWYKANPNLKWGIYQYKHLIGEPFRFIVQGLSLCLCLLNTKECLDRTHTSVSPPGCTEHSSGSC